MAKTRDNIIPIQDISLGGLSNSRWSGLPNSVYSLVGWDLHSNPGVIKPAQSLLKDSGTVVNEFCEARIVSTNGNTYWGSSESGKIWQEKAGTWTLVHTIVASAGEHKILEMYEWEGYIYIATQNKLHRILAANADGAAAWTANVALNWQTFTNGDTKFHPMIDVNRVLYIGDGYLVAQVDAGVFSANALDIPTQLRVSCLGGVLTSLLIGTFIDDNVNKTTLFRWNTFSGSFDVSNQVDEIGINAIFNSDISVFVQAGRKGGLYQYDYQSNTLSPYKTIPGEYSPTKEAIVKPNAIATFNKAILFGVSKGNNLLGGLEDDFDDDINDTFLWPVENQVLGATIVEADGQLQITFPSASVNGTLGSRESATIYDLTSSQAYVQFVTVPSATTHAQMAIKVQIDSNNYYQWIYENGLIKAQYNELGAGVVTPFSDTYDPLVHVWFRIRESEGVIYWDTSVDGVIWTNRTSYTYTINVSDVQVVLRGYAYQAETDAGQAIFDNFNLPGSQVGLKDPIKLGIYSVGRHSSDYPFVIDLTYPISQRIGSDFVLSGVEIGAILVKGTDFLVSWRYGANVGIDRINYASRLDGAYFETRVISTNRSIAENFAGIILAYYTMPDHTDILIQKSVNYAAYESVVTVKDTLLNVLRSEEAIEASTLQVKFIAQTSGNYAPEIESAGIPLE